jgi:hypothetical protein
VDLFAFQNHTVFFQGPGWRTRYVSAIEVVFAVVARAPNHPEVALVLHCAIEVRANRRKGAELISGAPHKQHWLVSESNDNATVFRNVRKPAGVYACDFHLRLARGLKIGKQRIQQRGHPRDKCTSQYILQKIPLRCHV